MKKMRLGLVLLISLMMVSGCINYSEETWLKGNGSGRMKMAIGISEALMSMSPEEGGEGAFSDEGIKNAFKGKKGIRMKSAKTYNKDGNKVMDLEIEYESLKALEALGNSDNTSFIGKITLKKNKKGQLVFTRVLTFSSPNAEKEKDEEYSAMGEEMMAGLFANYVWRYTVHFPYKVISANTSDDAIDRKTNTVKWDVSLASLIKKPQKMTAVLRPYNFFESVLHRLNLYH